MKKRAAGKNEWQLLFLVSYSSRIDVFFFMGVHAKVCIPCNFVPHFGFAQIKNMAHSREILLLLFMLY